MKGTLTAAHGQQGRPLECIVMETHGKTWMQWISSNGAPIRIEVLQVDVVPDFHFFIGFVHIAQRFGADGAELVCCEVGSWQSYSPFNSVHGWFSYSPSIVFTDVSV